MNPIPTSRDINKAMDLIRTSGNYNAKVAKGRCEDVHAIAVEHGVGLVQFYLKECVVANT